MNIDTLIRKITYSDNSKKHLLVIKTENGLSEMKISQKEYNNLKRIGVKCAETIYTDKIKII